MSTRLLVFLILQSWRFPALGGWVRWLVWSELNKGILPSSLRCTWLRKAKPGLITNWTGWLLVAFFPLPLSHGTAGLVGGGVSSCPADQSANAIRWSNTIRCSGGINPHHLILNMTFSLHIMHVLLIVLYCWHFSGTSFTDMLDIFPVLTWVN